MIGEKWLTIETFNGFGLSKDNRNINIVPLNFDVKEWRIKNIDFRIANVKKYLDNPSEAIKVMEEWKKSIIEND